MTLQLTGDNLRIRLYSVLIEWHRHRLKMGSVGTKAHVEIDNFHIAKQHIGGNASVIASPQDNFAAALFDLRLEEREALLLVVLEGFNYAQAARILKISPSVLVTRLARARASLNQIARGENFARPVTPHPPYLRLIK
jgi:RNA polymerase sigma-70 factor, ECF subfamily